MILPISSDITDYDLLGAIDRDKKKTVLIDAVITISGPSYIIQLPCYRIIDRFFVKIKAGSDKIPEQGVNLHRF